MADLQKYTVQEANNLQVYTGYSSQTITVDDDDADNAGTNWLTSGDGPAKEVTFVPFSGDATAVIKIWLKINGGYGDPITVKFDDFPITFNNLLIDQVKLQSDSGDSTAEVFEVISFH
mgnify:CR=1 FL=1